VTYTGLGTCRVDNASCRVYGLIAHGLVCLVYRLVMVDQNLGDPRRSAEAGVGWRPSIALAVCDGWRSLSFDAVSNQFRRMGGQQCGNPPDLVHTVCNR
jgi:hypothetical protein